MRRGIFATLFFYVDGYNGAKMTTTTKVPDPDPAIFVSDLQDANIKYLCTVSRFFAYYFLKVH